MTQQEQHDAAMKVMQKTAKMFRDAGIPDHAVPPAIADHLMMVTLALGRSSGLSYQAGEAIIKRMQNMLEDFRLGRPPFGDS
jgi:hypothetical protein